MQKFNGYRVVLSKAVPRDSIMTIEDNKVMLFHDRESLFRAMYWSALLPRLNRITRDCWEEWRAKFA